MNLRDKNDILRFLIHKIGTSHIKNKAVDLATKVKGILNILNTPYKDEDDMVSDSDTHLATQQSIKAYADKLKRVCSIFGGGGGGLTNEGYGWRVDAAFEWCMANLILPDNCTNITKVRIIAMARAVGVAGNYMAADITLRAATVNEVYNIHQSLHPEALSINKDYPQFAQMFWEITSGDVITNATGGDVLRVIVYHDTLAGEDSTNADFGVIEVEYI